MWLFIGQLIWLMLPAGIANIGASMSRYIPLLNYPVDSGKSWRGKRIFGAHKTWRGVVFGTLFGISTFWLQQYLYQFDFFGNVSLVNYAEQTWVFGLLLASGAVWGDIVKSFFKRRINRAPGESWMPFDQIDYAVGGLMAISFVYFPGWFMGFSIILFGFLLHIIFNLLGYLLKFQKNKL